MKKRLKVFISSTFSDLASERQTAARAISELQFETLHAEAIGVSDRTVSESLARAVEECDIFLGLYGSRYGYKPPQLDVSVTEFELQKAREAGKDILIYVKDGIEPDNVQLAFLHRAEAFEGGDLRRPRFRSLGELEAAVKEDLEALVTRRFLTRWPSEADSVEESYRAYVASLYGTISFAGLARTSGTHGVGLQEIFVDPSLVPYGDQKSAKVSQVSWQEVLASVRQWVLTGPPGCGKTVLLKQIALAYARSMEAVPVLVPLSFAREGLIRDDSDVESLVYAFARERMDPKFVPVIKEALGSGTAVLLLDGFDEIDSPGMRESVTRGIIGFCQRRPLLRVVVATRNSGVSTFSDSLPAYEISPWSDTQISQFASLWSAAVTRDLSLSAEPQAQANELLQMVQGNPEIRALAGNPMLMTVLAFLHRQGFRLPARRVEIYDVAARTLLSSWDMARSLSHTLGSALSDYAMETVLSAIAFGMLKQRVVVVSREEAIALAQRGAPAGKLTESDVTRALGMFVARSGILVESDPGHYAFVHKSFQEYFAARAIASLNANDARAFIVEHFFDDYYGEVVRLALAWLEGHGRASLVAQITEELANAARR
ncbi:MAG: DUF4062 domain-containing protein [Bryobacterales bacterium]|nr:DUF4062 domain-containing protein [Bryobacterales bacterium]